MTMHKLSVVIYYFFFLNNSIFNFTTRLRETYFSYYFCLFDFKLIYYLRLLIIITILLCLFYSIPYYYLSIILEKCKYCSRI